MVFFGKILTPLSDTKVDHYRDIQGIIVSATECFFLEYILDDRVLRRKVLLTDKDTEMSAEVPECRKLENR